MIYKDGYPMDSNLRVTACPLCGNEEFSDDAEFCRICGTVLYNNCEGQRIYDDFGKEQNEEVRKKSQEGLFKQKLISISSMIGVSLLSMMKKPLIIK